MVRSCPKRLKCQMTSSRVISPLPSRSMTIGVPGIRCHSARCKTPSWLVSYRKIIVFAYRTTFAGAGGISCANRADNDPTKVMKTISSVFFIYPQNIAQSFDCGSANKLLIRREHAALVEAECNNDRMLAVHHHFTYDSLRRVCFRNIRHP